MNDIDRLLKEGIAAVKSGQRTKARALLREVIRRRSNDANAWLWLSGAVETDSERRECLEKVLEIDPNNPNAMKGLQKLPPRVAPRAPTPVAAARPSTPSVVTAAPDPSAESRRHLLERESEWHTSRGWQVVFQSGTAVQFRKGKELKYVAVEQIEQRIAKARARSPFGTVQPDYQTPYPMAVRLAPPKDRGIALILEILPGLFGVFGFGWIYSGNTSTGILWLVGTFFWIVIAAVIIALSAGIGFCCVAPFSIMILAISVSSLNTYTKQHPELFGP